MSSKKNNLFRKSSIERVSSPEQLNEYIKTTNPNLILIIISVFSILFAGFVWVFTSNIPKYQEIKGIVVSENGEKKLYSLVDIGTSMKLKVGMESRVSPTYFPVEEYGYINGRISKIGTEIITEDYILDKFLNANLFFMMFPNYYNCVEIVTVLKSSSQNKINLDEIIDGSQCTSSIVIGNQRAVDIVMNK